MGVGVVPYAASAAWYAEWLHALQVGICGDAAVEFANDSAGVSGKDFARCRIAGSVGGVMLSQPIEGGAARLKRTGALRSLILSEHGNWRRMHIGALSAAYGRTPYYQHFMPHLEAVYSSCERSLSRFNDMIHCAVAGMLMPENDAPSSFLAGLQISPAAAERGREIAASINPALSVVDCLMRYGKESLPGLLFLVKPESPMNIQIIKDCIL